MQVAPNAETFDDLPSPDTRKFRQARDSVVVTKSHMAEKPDAVPTGGEFKKLPRDSIAIAKVRAPRRNISLNFVFGLLDAHMVCFVCSGTRQTLRKVAERHVTSPPHKP